MRNVAVLAVEGFVPFDLGIPCEVFGTARTRAGKPAYRVRVCAEKPETRSRAFRLRTPWRLEQLAAADTVVIPGIEDVSVPVSKHVLAAIRKAWTSGARVASICSGSVCARGDGAARWPPSYDSLDWGYGVRTTLSQASCRCGRPVRGRGPHRDFRRRSRRARYVLASRAPRLRAGERRLRSTPCGHAARPIRRSSTVHSARAPAISREPRAITRVDARKPQ